MEKSIKSLEMISSDNIAVIIFNHALNEKAVQLKQRFSGKVDVFLFDSGSLIEKNQEKHFDKSFDNIYYNGLLNETNRFLKHHGYEIGVVITSDVWVIDVDVFLKKIIRAFDRDGIGVYAPSAKYSYHSHMIHDNGKDIQQVSFTEGFCFAFRSKILNYMCPVDINLNKFGYGTDVILGYHTLSHGYNSVVDYSIYVDHPYGSGYNKLEAVKAKNNWLSSLPKAQSLFYRIATKPFFNTSVGVFIVNLFFRGKR